MEKRHLSRKRPKQTLREERRDRGLSRLWAASSEKRRIDKWFCCCKIIRFRYVMCNSDPVSHVRTQFTGVMGSRQPPSADQYLRRKRSVEVSLSGPGTRRWLSPGGGGARGNMSVCPWHPRSWHTGPGAEVDLLAHAPRNWWLGSKERERVYCVLKTG